MLKIATWNLNKSKQPSLKADKQLECIKAQDADVWILTEWHESLTLGPNYHLAAQSSERSDIPDGFRWVSIWTRLPSIACLISSDRERTAVALIMLEGGKEFLVYGAVPLLEAVVVASSLYAIRRGGYQLTCDTVATV